MRLQELEFLDDKCQTSFDHKRVYQKCIPKWDRPREFQVGDLVLHENPKNQQHRDQKGKFEPNWLGPYIITVAFGSSACWYSFDH